MRKKWAKGSEGLSFNQGMVIIKMQTVYISFSDYRFVVQNAKLPKCKSVL
jgi:hypothetical protein